MRFNSFKRNYTVLSSRFLILDSSFHTHFIFDTSLVKSRRNIFKPVCFLWLHVPEFPVPNLKWSKLNITQTGVATHATE